MSKAMNMKRYILSAVAVFLSAMTLTSVSGADAGSASFKNLDQEVQDLKKALMELNRDLFILEEELLFPANTQLSVFVSMDVGEYFSLDSVELKLDGKKVSTYLYTEKEAEALLRGGVQRLHIGNLKAGEHELVAVFTGKGSRERDYRRATTLEFEKGLSAKFVELQIRDKEKNMQPEFNVKEWE